MVTIQPKTEKDIEGNACISPSSEIPPNSKVRFINGVFKCIAQDEEWPEE